MMAGCKEPNQAKGICSKHYDRWREWNEKGYRKLPVAELMRLGAGPPVRIKKVSRAIMPGYRPTDQAGYKFVLVCGHIIHRRRWEGRPTARCPFCLLIEFPILNALLGGGDGAQA